MARKRKENATGCSLQYTDPVKHLLLQPLMRLRNLLTDLTFAGRFLGQMSGSRYAHLGAHPVGASDYTLLGEVFRQVPITSDDVVVDIGCGTGRVLAWWERHSSATRIIGLEIDPDLAERTRRLFTNHLRVTVAACNAVEHLPREGTLFFLYNSLGEERMIQLEQALYRLPETRPVRLVYFNPAFPDSFSAERWTRDEIDLTGYGKLPGACLLFERKRGMRHGT